MSFNRMRFAHDFLTASISLRYSMSGVAYGDNPFYAGGAGERA